MLFNKSVFFVLLTVFIGSSFNVFGMRPTGKPEQREKLTLDMFYERFAQEIGPKCSVERLETLLKILENNTEIETNEEEAYGILALEIIDLIKIAKSKTKPKDIPVITKKPIAPLVPKKPVIKQEITSGLTDEGYVKMDVSIIIAQAKKKGILKSQLCLVVNKKITNNIYQLTVPSQHDLSCGARALYNCQVFIEILRHIDPTGSYGEYNDLLDLFADSSRLTKFFTEMRNAKTMVDLGTKDGKLLKVVIDELDKMTYLDEQGNVVESDKMEKPLLNRAIFHNGAPQNIEGDWTDSFVLYCNSKRNCQFKFGKKIFCAESEKPKSCVSAINWEGPLKNMNIGYYNTYVVHLGSRNSGHFVSVAVIKTGENEYSWFVSDSLNNDLLAGDTQLKKFISGLCVTE